jgi:hypothetical protein
LNVNQIKWRTRITDEQWPDVERELVALQLVARSGKPTKPIYSLTEDFLKRLGGLNCELPNALKCPKCGSKMRRVTIKVGSGVKSFLGCTAHPECNGTRNMPPV